MMMMKKKKKKSPLLSHPPKRHRTSNLVDVPYELAGHLRMLCINWTNAVLLAAATGSL